ncbi:MAG TPA: hypothetical protein PLO50_06845 [Nitrospira sp.]|nr:hypothetical protein [Nitrospira sp.]
MSDYDGKYRELTEHLLFTGMDEGSWTATFKEIEDILRFKLPDSARKHQAWWANQGKGQSASWMMAGRRTSAVDLKNETVTFELHVEEIEPKPIEPLTIAQAKERLAATLGVDASQIEITIRA